MKSKRKVKVGVINELKGKILGHVDPRKKVKRGNLLGQTKGA